MSYLQRESTSVVSIVHWVAEAYPKIMNRTRLSNAGTSPVPLGDS